MLDDGQDILRYRRDGRQDIRYRRHRDIGIVIPISILLDRHIIPGTGIDRGIDRRGGIVVHRGRLISRIAGRRIGGTAAG